MLGTPMFGVLRMDFNILDQKRDIMSTDNAKEEQRTEKINLIELCFSFRGRISRKLFLLKGILVQIILFLLLYFSLSFSFKTSWFFVAPIQLLLAWIGFAASVQRFHDLGRSGWLATILYLSFPLAIFLIGPFIMLPGPLAILCLVPVYATLVYFLWAMAKLIFEKGTGTNKFGSGPLEDIKTNICTAWAKLVWIIPVLYISAFSVNHFIKNPEGKRIVTIGPHDLYQSSGSWGASFFNPDRPNTVLYMRLRHDVGINKNFLNFIFPFPPSPLIIFLGCIFFARLATSALKQEYHSEISKSQWANRDGPSQP